MQKIIKDAQIINDSWQLITAEEITLDQLPNNEKIIVPLTFWQEHKAALKNRQTSVGIWLSADQQVEQLQDDLTDLPLIALDFPNFTDGRHYSSARILRDRYKYQGEIRAIGDVLKDQLFAMRRCGFNAFAVKADKNIEDALQSLHVFTEYYQGATIEPLPLFRRR